MQVTQVTIGRFSQFNLARQLEKHGLLKEIWTGYPRHKLKNEKGIPSQKIKTFPWLQTPFMARGLLGLNKWKWLDREWAWWSHESLDWYVSNKLEHPTILLGMSGSGLKCGRAAKKKGGKYVCHRGSTHISFQNNILKSEYERNGLRFQEIDPRMIEKEQQEYEEADIIVVPSDFAYRSFVEMGVNPSKVKTMVYGARVERFSRLREPAEDTFRVLWVGAISVRKGFLDALHAFQKLKHPSKEFIVIGSIQKEMQELIAKEDTSGVIFKGNVPNEKLIDMYNDSHVFILSSIEDGFGVVIGEALACGCPVIATTNTGGNDMFTDGVEGFIVPIRSPEIIAERLQSLADQPLLRKQMADAAVNRIQAIGGWDSYGSSYAALLKNM